MKGFACLAGFLVCGYLTVLAQEPVLQIGAPLTAGRTTLVPILGAGQDGSQEFITLVEAAKAGSVDIREGGPGTILVKNNSPLPLLLMEGNVVIGGHQDQTIQQSVTLMPNQTVSVAVYCIEPSRGSGAALFKAGDYLVPDFMRVIEARCGRNAQREIWNEVAKINRSQSVNPPTGALRASFENPDFISAVQFTASKFEAVADSSAVIGMMVLLDGRILSADIFDNHKTFEHARADLLNLYAIDSNLLAADSSAQPAGPDQCQTFLNEIASAPRSGFGRTESSVWFRLGSRYVIGTEVGIPGRPGIVHGTYFAQ